MSRVLVVDDDPRLQAMLRRGLLLEGYEVETAASCEQARAGAAQHAPDVMILDLALPDGDGVDLCRELRRSWDFPILMLTARDEVSDRVVGLDAGADDYLVKPFSFDELLARLRALLRRRGQAGQEPALRYADVVVNTATREAWRGGRPLSLTPKEYDLLCLFLRHPRQVLTRDTIQEQVWGYDFPGESNVLEVYIGYLRHKLEAAGEPRLLHTVRGVGYRLQG